MNAERYCDASTMIILMEKWVRPILEVLRNPRLGGQNKSSKSKSQGAASIRGLRIDKGSRCVLRYTYAFLITLIAFLVL